MKFKLFMALVAICSVAAPAQLRTPAKPLPVPQKAKTAAEQLPIRRVILYSNGVAYVERRGIVTGAAEVNLAFKQSQVDDVLKSMVVLDLGKESKIGAVSYNSSAPVSSQMSEIPFAIGPLTGEGGGLAGVLAQLQGAKVSVAASTGTASGSIVTVEKRQKVTDKTVSWSSILVIASETGEISSFDLADVRSLKLLDEGTRRDLNEFANAAASTRRRDAKTITITSDGAGPREMIVSYTIAAPIWKTTYRVVLDEAGKPFFQGWAIVDNISDEDWKDVRLSLVSGSPISFIQPIQKPFYRYRPVVPMPRDLQLTPQTYEPVPGLSVKDAVDNRITTQSEIQNLPTNGRNLAQLNVSPQYSSANTMVIDGADSNEARSNFRTVDRTVSDALQNSSESYRNTTVGEEIGDLFEYRIEQPVTVLRDRSALIPIVQTKMDGERVAVYNESVRIDRPYSGVLLKNNTDLTLESGSLTVLDNDAYAGEALMDRLKSKEQRLISFALDLGTHVRVRNDADREPAKLVKVVNGVFQVHYFQTSVKRYQITNQTNRKKTLYIEYPVRDGWTLSDDSPKPDYVTQKYYRFRVELDGFQEKELKIAVRQGMADNYQLYSLSRNDVQLFVSQRYINDETRGKLEKIIDLRMRLGEIEQKLEGFDDEVEAIESDQKRLRDNIEALSKTAEAKTLITRYIQKANDQETRLEEMEKERKALEAEKIRLTGEIAQAIRAFSIE